MPRPAFSVCILLQLLVLTTSLAPARAADKPCTLHENGNYYDLNPLKGSQDYQISVGKGREFIFNVCKSVSHDLWNVKVDDPGEVAGFTRRERGDFSVGQVNTTLALQNDRVVIVSTGGSTCKDSDRKASTSYQLICDKSVFASGKPQLIAQQPEGDDACYFVVEWRTHYACPTGEMIGSSGILVTLLVGSLCLIMAYLITGTIYNRFVLGLSGYDQIPQFKIDSLKYHVSNAVEMIREWLQAQNWAEGRRRVVGGVNSVSHQWMQGGDGSRDGGIRSAGGVANRVSASRGHFNTRREEGTRDEEESMLGDDLEAGELSPGKSASPLPPLPSSPVPGAVDRPTSPTALKSSIDAEGVIRF